LIIPLTFLAILHALLFGSNASQIQRIFAQSASRFRLKGRALYKVINCYASINVIKKRSHGQFFNGILRQIIIKPTHWQ